MFDFISLMCSNLSVVYENKTSSDGWMDENEFQVDRSTHLSVYQNHCLFFPFLSD